MVDEFIRRNRPDVIINCAAYTNVDGCEVNHDAAFKDNAIGPQSGTGGGKTVTAVLRLHDYVFSGRENGGICGQAAFAAASAADLPSSWAKSMCGAVLLSAMCAPRALQLLRRKLRECIVNMTRGFGQLGGQRPVGNHANAVDLATRSCDV